MRPALDGMSRLGGSHAQQDVLWQIYVDCAVAARNVPEVRRVIEHVERVYRGRPGARLAYAALQGLPSH
jgi:hypothetical protein